MEMLCASPPIVTLLLYVIQHCCCCCTRTSTEQSTRFLNRRGVLDSNSGTAAIPQILLATVPQLAPFIFTAGCYWAAVLYVTVHWQQVSYNGKMKLPMLYPVCICGNLFGDSGHTNTSRSEDRCPRYLYPCLSTKVPCAYEC